MGGQGQIVVPVLLEEYMKDSKEGRILDVAAGTGRAGAVLHKLGFSNIDALDVSKMMLEKAKEKNVYNQVIQGKKLMWAKHLILYEILLIITGFDKEKHKNSRPKLPCEIG